MTPLSSVLLFTLVFCQLMIVWCVIMLWRNRRVHAYLIALLEETSEAAKIEIQLRHHDARWRINEVSKADYNEMVIKFWRPLDSFFPKRNILTNGNSVKENYYGDR